MTRRTVGGLLSLLLLLALAAPLSSRTLAADSVYFTAANDELCPLKDETMPFWSGGNLYVPGVVFGASYGLGITYVRDTAAQTAFLYAGRLALEFDLANGGANDRSGTYYSASALRRNGTVYFPVAFVSNYFGLSYSVQETAYAPVVRLCNGKQILTDRQFIDAASITLMPSYYSAYQRSKKPAVTPKPEDDPGGGTTDPEEETPVDETPPGGASQVLLAVRADSGSQTAAMLNTLDRYGYKAAFFFTPEALEGQDDLLRRIVASGHRLGLCLPGGSGADVLDAANEQLRRRTGVTTRMVLADQAGEVQAAGYAVYTPTVQPPMGATAASRVSAVMNRVEKGSGTIKLLLEGDEISAAALTTVCANLSEGRYTVRAVTEVACAGA